MREFMEDFGYEALGILAITVVCAGLIFGMVRLAWYTSERECDAKTQYMGFDNKWDRWAGCQIEVNPGQWIPLDSYYFKQE